MKETVSKGKEGKNRRQLFYVSLLIIFTTSFLIILAVFVFWLIFTIRRWFFF